MLAHALAATPWGIDARPVRVEVDVSNGLPKVDIVGLPDAAVRESRQRVRSAIKNCGFELPPRSITVNLAPADLRKEGNHLDLAIALALLSALGQLPQEALGGRLLCGELGLDGSIRPIRGGLSIAQAAAEIGLDEVLLPPASARQAAALELLPVIGLSSLPQAVDHLLGDPTIPPSLPGSTQTVVDKAPDLADVRGQAAARRALEVAAAGGHNLLLIGPPGAGKTMLAKRLAGLLPPLTREESVAVTKVHSIIAAEPPPGLLTRRPFRSPHPGASSAALVGGGTPPRPGEVSLAHAGVLFLDELPEFRREALEALRQPLEDGLIHIARAHGRLCFPARTSLIAAMNPCRCGHLGDPRLDCRCSPREIERYRQRISGPLLDRIDLHVEVPPVTLAALKGPPGEPTTTVASRIGEARKIQQQRFAADDRLTGAIPVNASLEGEALLDHCRLDAASQQLLDRAFDRLALSARALGRILKVSRTLADLAGGGPIESRHVAEAIQYRSLDRRME